MSFCTFDVSSVGVSQGIVLLAKCARFTSHVIVCAIAFVCMGERATTQLIAIGTIDCYSKVPTPPEQKRE